MLTGADSGGIGGLSTCQSVLGLGWHSLLGRAERFLRGSEGSGVEVEGWDVFR